MAVRETASCLLILVLTLGTIACPCASTAGQADLAAEQAHLGHKAPDGEHAGHGGDDSGCGGDCQHHSASKLPEKAVYVTVPTSGSDTFPAVLAPGGSPYRFALRAVPPPTRLQPARTAGPVQRHDRLLI